jgi:CHAT domain-containing protein
MLVRFSAAIGLSALAVLAITSCGTRPADDPLQTAAAAIDRLYAQNRPFPYRWAGAGFAPARRQNGCAAVSEGKIYRPSLKIREAEKRAGQTARSLQLQGRINLLLCRPAAAIEEFNLALLLQPDDPVLDLELGIAFAVEAGMDPELQRDGALDYEAAMEAMLRCGRRNPPAEFLFDSALLFEEARLPLQAEEQWSQAIMAEPWPQWRSEELARQSELQNALWKREQEISMFTAQPGAFPSRSDHAADGAELALNAAIETWLPEMQSSAALRLPLKNLGQELVALHHDRWLLDVMGEKPSAGQENAFQDLSRAVRSNLKGEYLSAGSFARAAERSFRQSNNPAGALRARIETVYSLDRRFQSSACLSALKDVRASAERHGYMWIAAQAWLEEITCHTRTRKEDVILARKEAYEWITSHTGYDGLALRALGFMTEEYVSAESRLTLWQRDEQGLRSFWSKPLPALRGYSFYFTLAESARQTGKRNAAVALLRESTLMTKDQGYPAVRAMLLSYLGVSQLEAGLDRAAKETYAEVDTEFGKLNPRETKNPKMQSEAIYAEALISSGHPDEGLAQLQQVTKGLQWPFKELVPNIRRPLLPALGDAYLALNNLAKACHNYERSIRETLRDMESVHDPAQRDTALHEDEQAWRGMTSVILRMGRPRDALNVWEQFRSSRNPKTARAWRTVPDCSARASASFFPTPDNHTMIVYAFLPGGLYGWIVNGSDIRQSWIDPQKATTLALRFAELASAPDSPMTEISARAQELYKLLLAPFADKLPANGTILVDADGALAGTPWDALEDRPGHPLLERFSFSQETGLARLPGKKNRVDMSKALIFGSPALPKELAQEYPSLPEITRQAENLHHRLPGSMFFEDQEATSDTFRNHAGQTTLFYFAGHGISYGGFGALLLAPAPGAKPSTQYMTAQQIAGLDLSRMKLVVLAACSSGVGEHSGVVNLDSLTRAFLEAGAGRVIAANWEVDSMFTAELMSNFYDRLMAGVAPAEALRQAGLALRGRFPHPRFWASFRVFGMP